MESELTTSQKWRKRIAVITAALVIVALAAGAVLFYNSMSGDLAKQGEASLRDAALRSAGQCFAIEGAYPPSIQYLEDNYGLVLNHDDYMISYELFADNVIPNIMVNAR